MRKPNARPRSNKGTKPHTFVQYQQRVLGNANFLKLSGNAHKLVNYLASQFTGFNNGNLGIAWKIAKDKGWTSNGSLKDAAKELTEAGFIVLTRQGGRNRCSLYALAWLPIDDCNGKLDVPASKVALNTWLWNGRLSEPRAVQLAPPPVQSAENQTQEACH
jgi:hypothetical protein